MTSNHMYSSISENAPLQAGLDSKCSTEKNNQRVHCQPLTSRVVSWLTLASLFYLIGLGHTLLNKLQSNAATPEYTTYRGSIQHFDRTDVFKEELIPPATNTDTLNPPLATPRVLIVYGPPDDPWQQEMANAVLEGCQSIPHSDCRLLTVATATFDDVQAADAIVLGSSVENANTHFAVQQWIDQEWDIFKMIPDKIGAAFVTAGGISAGQEGTLKRLLESMMVFRMLAVGGESWESAFGVAAVTAEPPFAKQPSSGDENNTSKSWFPRDCYLPEGQLISPMFLDQAKGLGRRVARLVVQRVKR